MSFSIPDAPLRLLLRAARYRQRPGYRSRRPKISLLLAGLLLSNPLAAQVGNADLQDIRKLVTAGRYEEALQKHLWFHEESKSSVGMGGVRLSFALAQWLELGRKYPPALAELKKVRDANEATLLEGAGSFPEFHDFSAINRTLKEEDRTYQLFLQLDARHPAIAKRCFEVTLDLIVAHQNYDLFAKYGGDPIERYERSRHLHETGLQMAAKTPQLDNERYRQFRDKAFEDKTAQLIKILVELKRLDEAREIQKRALAYLPSPKIEQSLPRR